VLDQQPALGLQETVAALEMPAEALGKHYCSAGPAVEQAVRRVVLDQA
jgi:hypothetical protein